MIAPKPSETFRNLPQVVSLLACGKVDRNLRNHSLKGEGDLVSPPRAHSHTLRSSRNFAPLALRSRFVLARSLPRHSPAFAEHAGTPFTHNHPQSHCVEVIHVRTCACVRWAAVAVVVVGPPCPRYSGACQCSGNDLVPSSHALILVIASGRGHTLICRGDDQPFKINEEVAGGKLLLRTVLQLHAFSIEQPKATAQSYGLIASQAPAQRGLRLKPLWVATQNNPIVGVPGADHSPRYPSNLSRLGPRKLGRAWAEKSRSRSFTVSRACRTRPCVFPDCCSPTSWKCENASVTRARP
jgi:hypothetical protein